jgi:hypothetical protein
MLPLRGVTPWPTPQMVSRRCSDISIPGSRYSAVDRNEKPPGWCGINALRPTEKVDCRMIRQLSTVGILTVSVAVQTHVAWFRRWIKEVIVIDYNTLNS